MKRMRRIIMVAMILFGVVSLSACAGKNYLRVQEMAPVAISQPAPPVVSVDKQKK